MMGGTRPRAGGVVPPPRPRRHGRFRSVFIACWLATLVVAAGCSPSADTSPSSTPTATASGSLGPTPRPTAWPTLTIEAAVALGAAQNDFQKMLDDVAAAVAAEDPARIRIAMDDAIRFLSGNEQNIPRLQAYEGTKALGDRLAPVYAKMISGATQVRDGLTSGDGAAVEAGFTAFLEGQTEYAGISSDVAVAAEQALFMQRVLLR
ncbi:MAG TPA: hypothetical protein VFX65_11670 [Candidatus Limnocylindrales bacterium]|nr:hypothetical protein [Candidatus Limnocylindrales bacterium]